MILFDLSPLVDTFGSLSVGIAITVTLGLFIGVASAAFGVGGGFLITPFCHSILHLPAALAVATSMGQIPFMGLSGVARYARARIIDLRLAALLLVTGIPSAQIVAHWLAGRPARSWPTLWLGQSLPDLIILGTFTLCIGGLGLYNLRRSFSADPVPRAGSRSNPTTGPALPTLLVGTVFGGLSALLGIGGGFFAVPYFVYVCGLTPVAAVATSLFAVLVTSVVTTAHYLWLGQLYFGISLLIACGSIVGAQLGARLALAARPHILLRFIGGMQITACAVYLSGRLI